MPTPPDTPIEDELAAIWDDVSDEEWAKLPTDLAANHDHYLCGTPKRGLTTMRTLPDIDDYLWETLADGVTNGVKMFAVYRTGTHKERLIRTSSPDLARSIVDEHNREMHAMHDAMKGEHGNG